MNSSFSTAPDIFKPLLKCSIFKCISYWLNGSFFGGVNIGVFWKRKSRPIEWRQCRLSTRQLYFVCTSIVYAIYGVEPWITDGTLWRAWKLCVAHARSENIVREVDPPHGLIEGIEEKDAEKNPIGNGQVSFNCAILHSHISQRFFPVESYDYFL